MDPLSFLRQIPPFDRLGEAALNDAAAAVTVVRIARGSRILEQGGPPSTHLNLVRQGEVALMQDGRMIQVLEEGELFGYPSMLGHEPPLFDATAATDVVLYRLPEADFRALLSHAAVADYFLRSLGERLRSAATSASPTSGQNLAVPVKFLVTGAPLFVDAEATVQQAAQRMLDAGASSVLVKTEPLGIITDRDLRGRVLAAGLGPETRAGTVMSRPLVTLDSDAPVFAAMMLMLEQNIHHLALMEEGDVVGVVSTTDLLRHQAQSPLYLSRKLQTADGHSDLAGYADDVAHSVESLFHGGLGAAQIGRITSSLNDSLTHRLVSLAEAELGPPPTPYAWIVFGSEGRSEQMLLTDQDNALVYAEDVPGAADYFAALAAKVVEGLIHAGFPPCPGGYMATNWCKPLAAWQKLFDGWVRTPEPQALMEAGIFLDFRCVYGTLSLEPLEEILTQAHKHGIFIAHMVRAAQEFSPPLGFFGRIRSEGGKVDIKKGGIAPIVGLARACALAAGSRERSTLERLAVAANAGTISRVGAENLAETFQFLLRLRLRQQLADLQAGQTPSNQLSLDTLSGMEQRHLKDALVNIRQMQDGIGATFNTGMMR
jgi:CBS domain-containing protein